MRGGDLRAAAHVAGTVRRTYDGGAADRWHSALTREPGTTGRAEPEEKSRILPGKFSGRSRLCLRGSSAEDPRTRPRHHRRTHLSSRGRAPADGFPRTPTKLSRCAKPAIRPSSTRRSPRSIKTRSAIPRRTLVNSASTAARSSGSSTRPRRMLDDSLLRRLRTQRVWLPAAHDGWVPQPLRRPGARHRPGAFTRRTGPRLSCSGPSPGSGWREHSYVGSGEDSRISIRITHAWVRV